jgi:hypothetical protein
MTSFPRFSLEKIVSAETELDYSSVNGYAWLNRVAMSTDLPPVVHSSMQMPVPD